MAQNSNVLTIESLAELASAQQTPCLSLYQPTHRSLHEKQHDPIRFHNLVIVLESSLRQNFPSIDTQALMEPFRALVDDAPFWNQSQEGLAVLASPGLFRVFQLQRPIAELAVVADSFHTKPLRRLP